MAMKESRITYKDLLEEYEQQLLTKLMKEYKKAAVVSRKMEINKSTLSRKLRKYNIDAKN